jgi:hypothetical protein
VDVTENYPSLINCLETWQNGLYLDLDFPSGGHGDETDACVSIGPFSKTIPARIKTDGDGVIKRVLLVLQRDDYDAPGSLLPVNNPSLETAWQNAFAFHRNGDPAKAPLFFKHQVSPTGEFRSLQPLFCCNETRRWFHPVCPQCGLALTLCRDDALLKNRGLPTFSDSLERFLYCDSCATQSDSSAFYRRDKATGMPDIVYDSETLVAHWKQLLAKFPDGADLPCRGCPEKDVCYGPEALVSQRIVPFSFFPFYMLMFPAPSCMAAEFIALISGDAAAAQRGTLGTAAPSGQSRFLFQGQGRQFLETLYLKLTFLAQVCRQLLPADDSAANRELALSLDGIGVDLNPAGAGLPEYWNFNVRMLDAVGIAQTRPFAPITPEAPRLHFLGAVWFRALLVNSRQQANTVYAEVGRLINQMGIEDGADTLKIEASDPKGVFACRQIFWVPDQRQLAGHWQGYWKQAMHLGFQLVHAGSKTGVLWDPVQFRSALDALRNQIKDEMFSGLVIASTEKERTVPSDTIRMVLHEILQKWKAASALPGSLPVSEVEPETPDIEETVIMASSKNELGYSTDKGLSTAANLKATDIPATPAVDTDWDADMQETVIFSSSATAQPSESTPRDVPDPQRQDSQWNDEIEETVVLRTDATAPSPRTASPVDDTDQTVVISAPLGPSEPSPRGKEADLAATMIQKSPDPVPSSAEPDGDLEATIVLNTGGPSAPQRETLTYDDDLAATMVQGAGDRQPAPSLRPGISDLPVSDRPANGDDLDATVIIRQTSQELPPNQSSGISSGAADDDLAATLVETPRGGTQPGTDKPPRPPIPPQPPRVDPKSGPRDVSQHVAPTQTNDDDDIMEQTIIIRSDTKKE